MEKRQPHSATGKILHWTMCVRCGLVYVNNAATKKAIAEGCDPKSVARRQAYANGR